MFSCFTFCSFFSFLFFFLFFLLFFFFFFFQAEDGIRDADVTGVQTCALPIYPPLDDTRFPALASMPCGAQPMPVLVHGEIPEGYVVEALEDLKVLASDLPQIGRASCRERV